jgi:inward rectifier potassium channel
MTASWVRFFCAAAVIYLGWAAIFALIFWTAARLGYPPVANVQTGGFLDHFYFSVETLATVGYGDMHPQSQFGHIVATVEIFLGTMSIAILTGLVFSRFSRPRAQIMFANSLVISTYDGKPMLMGRFANARHNLISDATAKFWITRLETSVEGTRYRRFHELKLERNENPIFALSWTIFHHLEPSSILYGLDAKAMAEADYTFILSVRGLDETSNDDVHTRRIYSHREVRWNERFDDILMPTADGDITIDYGKIDATVPVTNER